MKTLLLLARNTLQSRWMVVVAGFFIMSVSGAIYAFGVYSGALKQALGYNQKQLTTVGFFKDFGNIGIFAGIIADLFPAWVTLSIGVAFNTFGYLMIWLAVTHRIAKPAIWQMYLYITIGGNSVAFTHAGALVTCVKDFPLHRGMIVGLLKGFLGLSTAILTLVYRAVYGNHPSQFILLIVYLPLAVILVFMFFIRPVAAGVDVYNESRVFYRLFVFELLVATYLMIVIVLQHTVDNVSTKSNNGAFAGTLVALLCVPFLMVIVMEARQLRSSRQRSRTDTEIPAIDNPEEKQPAKNEENHPEQKLDSGEENHQEPPQQQQQHKALARVEPRDSSEDENNNHNNNNNNNNHPDAANARPWYLLRKPRLSWEMLRTPPLGEDFTVWEALRHPDFWLMSAASTAGLGAGLMLIDNMGQIGASFGYDLDKTSTFVSLISIWNCLGRVCSGFVSEFFLQRTGLARPFFFALALAISALAYLAIALNLSGALFFGSILIGLCFGAQWALLHIIVSEVYGLKYYGTLQSIIAMASPLGTYLLSVRVAGYWYDNEADRQLAAGGTREIVNGKDVTCHGTICYKRTFLVMCAVCSAGCLLMLLMTLRTRRFYRRVVYEGLKAKKVEMTRAKEEQL